MTSTPNPDPTNWTPPESNCDKCGAPASWADKWTQNLPWKDVYMLHLATYLASPRMWPLGYILGSEYSPLIAEQQIPTINWRDAFEDLLALESGNSIISAASRQNEAATASRIRNESVRDGVSYVNQELQKNQDLVNLLRSLRECSVRLKDAAAVSMSDNEVVPSLKEHSDNLIERGKRLIDSLKDLQNKPASSYKRRVPWITSLISSGAMLGWESVVYDSDDGWLANFYKADSPDGQIFTERDLDMLFEQGYRLHSYFPAWSTFWNSYDDLLNPLIQQLCPDGNADPDAQRAYDDIRNIRPSIISQLTRAQLKKSWNGSIETRVVLKNHFSDGTEEEKTIVNDASKVLEEFAKVEASVKERHHFVGLALWKLRYQKQKYVLDEVKEILDEGVD